MGLIDDKRNTITEIGALISAKEGINIPDPTSSFSSINNLKEAIPFMMDVLTVLVGSEALKTAVGNLMTKFIRNVEPKLKLELKKLFIDFNGSQLLPSGFFSGYNIGAKIIDSFGKLRTDPLSDIGTLIYGNVGVDFDRRSYEAITSEGTNITFGNLRMRYNGVDDSFTYTPTSSSGTIGDFLDTYIDSLKIINETQFISNVMDRLFGTISNNQNKSTEQIILEEKINRTLEKIINEETSIDISDSELREIQNIAEQRKKGNKPLDVGCGVFNTNLSVESLTNLVNGNLNNTDPLQVGNNFDAALKSSYGDSNTGNRNQQTIKDGFFKGLIAAIVFMLVSSITTTPQIRVLLAITTAFKNDGNTDINDPVEDLKNRRTLVDCLSKEAKTEINSFFFDLVKKELIKLVIPVTTIILREKINQFLNILKSLV